MHDVLWPTGAQGSPDGQRPRSLTSQTTSPTSTPGAYTLWVLCCTHKQNKRDHHHHYHYITAVHCLMGACICSRIRFSGPSSDKMGKSPLTRRDPLHLPSPTSLHHHHYPPTDPPNPLASGQKRYVSAIQSHSPLPKMVNMRSPLPFSPPPHCHPVPAGLAFAKVVSVMSCTNLSSTSRCSPRHRPSPSSEGGKNPGTCSAVGRG